MLSWNQVLMYVKGRLALPSTFIEKSETEMKDWILLTAHKTFSSYFPDVEWTGVLIDDAKYQVPGKPGHFYFFDEEELDITGVTNCYFPLAEQYITGHPPIPPMSFEGMKWWALDVWKSRFFKPFSLWDRTVKFIFPNIVRVLPDPLGSGGPGRGPEASANFVVEYERSQPTDLRKIPATMHKMYLDLSLAECLIWIGSIRTMYSDTISTPFGDIPIRGQELYDRGVELKNQIEEILRDETVPSITVDVY